MQNRNRSILLVMMLTTVVAGTALAGGGSEASDRGGAPLVEVWGWRTQDAPVWEQVEAALQAQGENIAINYRAFPPTEYDAKLLVSLQGEAGPDIMYTRRLPGARTQALIDGAYMVPLDDRVDFGNFTQATLNFIRTNGTTWGVPFANQIIGIFYNARIYDAYGFEEPRTWDELVEIAATLQADGITPFFIPGKEAWALAMQHAMVGVSIPGVDWIERLLVGATNFLDPELVDLNTRLNDLKRYYQADFIANSTAEQDAAFALEEAAMVFYGIWGTTNWTELNPDFAFGYYPIPSADPSDPARAYVYMDGSYALNATSDVPEAALQVLQFSATPAFGAIFSATTGEMTAVANVSMPTDRPVLVEAYELSTAIAAEHIYWVGSPISAGTPSPYDILREGMQAMYLDQITPQELAQRLQEGVSTWYEPLQE